MDKQGEHQFVTKQQVAPLQIIQDILINSHTEGRGIYKSIPGCLRTMKCDDFKGNYKDQEYWMKLGIQDVENAQNQQINTKVAKNVILFVGDGMGPTTVTSSRIYGKTEKGFLAFERFLNIGVLKTYSANKLVPDSSSTATALFCGVKANHKTSGVDATVSFDDCEASLRAEARLKSIIDWAQKAGKRTGFVTTTRVTHATPSALYAHVPNRKWECESRVPDNATKCKDIARQLVEDLPGRNINVIMGGGRQCLVSNTIGTSVDPTDTWACYSKDGRNLIKDWQLDKSKRGLSYAVARNSYELEMLNLDAEFVLGIFANGHLKMEHARNRGPKGMPSLTNMTEQAIRVLRRNKEGFVLVVEGGMIDFGHHRGKARQALQETVEFSNAIEKSLDMIKDIQSETLVIVTSDHSHSLVFTGYADRTTSILDIAGKSKFDKMEYTSLLYGTGGPNNYQFRVVNDSVERINPSVNDTFSFDYSQQSGVLNDEVAHGGTDVLVYATGPWSHLFHTVHEQTYVAYVISYAARIGPLKDNSGGAATRIFLVLIFLCLVTCGYIN